MEETLNVYSKYTQSCLYVKKLQFRIFPNLLGFRGLSIIVIQEKKKTLVTH